MSLVGFNEFLPRNGGGPGPPFFPQFPDFPGDLIDLIPELIGPFLPGGGGGPPGAPPRPELPMPTTTPGVTPTFGTCRNTRMTSMPPSIAENGSLCCPSGWHLSTRKDPCTGNKNTCCVKNRRMNALNPRALSRSVRRLTSFNRTISRTQKALRKLAPPSSRRSRPAQKATCPTCR